MGWGMTGLVGHFPGQSLSRYLQENGCEKSQGEGNTGPPPPPLSPKASRFPLTPLASPSAAQPPAMPNFPHDNQPEHTSQLWAQINTYSETRSFGPNFWLEAIFSLETIQERQGENWCAWYWQKLLCYLRGPFSVKIFSSIPIWLATHLDIFENTKIHWNPVDIF